MIKLKTTHTFTSEDIANITKDISMEDVIFEAILYRPAEWEDFISQLLDDNISLTDKANIACQVLAKGLVSIVHSGKKQSIADINKVNELQASIESQAPGYGEIFIINLAWAVIIKQREAVDNRLKNSVRPLSQSENGNGLKKETLPAQP